VIWQDIVIAGGQWLFVAFLIPLRNEPPPILTALPTALVLGMLVLAFATLDLWNAALSSSVASCSWIWLAFRRIQMDNR